MDVKIQWRMVRCPHSAPNTRRSVAHGQQETEDSLGVQPCHLFGGRRGSCPSQLKVSGGVRKSYDSLHTRVYRSLVNKRSSP